MSEERKPWEQMEQEPDLWYGRFVKYLRLGTKRSVNAICWNENKKKQEKTRTNTGPEWYEAAKQWKWEERARLWDKDQEKLRAEKEEKQRNEDLKAVREMLLKHIQADVDKSSTSQIQAAKLLLEYYATSSEISQIKEELHTLQETLKSLGAEL